MLWPISFVADMVVADMVCGRYRRFPNRLSVSIHIEQFLAKAGGVVNPVKIFLLYNFITIQNLVAVSHTVCMHVEVPLNFW